MVARERRLRISPDGWPIVLMPEPVVLTEASEALHVEKESSAAEPTRC